MQSPEKRGFVVLCRPLLSIAILKKWYKSGYAVKQPVKKKLVRRKPRKDAMLNDTFEVFTIPNSKQQCAMELLQQIKV